MILSGSSLQTAFLEVDGTDTRVKIVASKTSRNSYQKCMNKGFWVGGGE